MRTGIAWGVVVGLFQAASPLAFWWLDPATVYAIGLAVIASVYIGFAVADGRVRIIVVECGVAKGIRGGRRGGDHRLGMAPRVRARGARGEGRVAATQPIRLWYPLVAAVLRRRRLGRRVPHRDRDRRRDPLPAIAIAEPKGIERREGESDCGRARGFHGILGRKVSLDLRNNLPLLRMKP